MIHNPPNNSAINLLKERLNECIILSNYDLLSKDVLSLSLDLDALTLPYFKEQLEYLSVLSKMPLHH